MTAPPYAGVHVLRDALLDAGVEVEMISLDHDFSRGVHQLQQIESSSPTDVVTVGGACLPVRWWLGESGSSVEVRHLVMVAPPNGGSVTAGMLYTETMAASVERYRLERDMYRVEGGPQWLRPEYVSAESYLAERTMYLYEPLYGSFLVDKHMSLMPAPLESSSSFLSWLTGNYSSVRGYLTDSETPVAWQGTLAELEIGEAGQVLTWGYLDLMAAQIAGRTFFTTVPMRDVLTDGMLGDVTLGQDLKTSIWEFARRRLFHFVEHYVMPHLMGAGRDMAARWLMDQLALADEVLLYQLPERVQVPGRGEVIAVESNRLLADMSNGAWGSVVQSPSVIAVRSPNWWQLLDPLVGPNDWWTEIDATRPPGGSTRTVEVFAPVGGRADDDAVVAAVLEALGLEQPDSAPTTFRGIMTVIGRVADTIMGFVGRLRGSGSHDSSPVYEGYDHAVAVELGHPGESPHRDDEEIPEIRAIYRNKSTTLKNDRTPYHQYWVWDFGDGYVSVDDDRDNVTGQVTHTYAEPGEYLVSSESLAPDGTVLRRQEWEIEAEDADWTAVFDYGSAVQVIPRILLTGPESWMTGRPARYSVEVELDPIPAQVDNLRAVVYPGEDFDVIWERPGTFEVKAAVNLRYSWRFEDGSSRYFTVVFTETMSVEVFATTVR